MMTQVESHVNVSETKAQCCTEQETAVQGGHHGEHNEPKQHVIQAPHRRSSLNRTALMATIHCLTGCTIGEVIGMALGTALGWGTRPTIGLAVALAFVFGYAMTLWPLRQAGLAWGSALNLAFASDTLSMTTMELVDNAIMLVIPGAMNAGLVAPLFWGSLAISMLLAGVAAFPVNRWLIEQGKGHALVHSHHGC
ncbi:hypothetical protein W02_01770 [Nitrospira sp. KM1]|uniref:DUF4396 domain-containing protein n=1 Tax=Nitrospira sp. KM1 TaxID=1936990 RepID=UPI0013A75003|nr:DUF4396 domain-containing protein [Nitrospira sp. KM1]BCA53037.1 hypothetical protein W02_01770 [Nitrospira sp. KM1]